MSARVRVALAAICVVAIAVVGLPGQASAQRVLNPGVVALTAEDGQLRIGSLIEVSLFPNPLPECADGIDNDGDGRIDLDDRNCVAGPNGEPAWSDNSELAPGYQPKVDVSITGTIEPDGSLTVQPADVIFPPAYVPVQNPFDGTTSVLTARVVPTAPATGFIDPITGAAELNVAFRIRISGTLFGNPISSACAIGTNNNPIRMNLVTGLKPAIGQAPPLLGVSYSATTGRGRVVDNAFSVPGASGCQAGFLDISGIINDQAGIPSGAGRNLAVIDIRTGPVLGKGVDARIVSNPPVLGGAAPLIAELSAATSVVAKGPATYEWTFSDGTTAAGLNVVKTFASPGPQSVTLRVTDADGDADVRTIDFVLGGTTTSTTSTTVPPTTSTTTTTTTSTTVPPTTSTTTTTTSTTVPPTTSTTTTTTSTTVPPTTSTTTTTTSTTVPPTTSTTTTTTSTTVPPTTSTTSTTVPPTTSTTSTTVPPTTSTTSTTVPPTTSTTVPPDSRQPSAEVRLRGAVNYANAGQGSGDVRVERDAFGIRSVRGSVLIPGVDGGTSTVTVNAVRAWILPIWSGEVVVRDPGAGVSVTTPLLGSVSGAGQPGSARGSTQWFVPGSFPNLFQPYTLTWTVVDGR